MASQFIPKLSVFVVIGCVMLISSCSYGHDDIIFDTSVLNFDMDDVTSEWRPAVATWYGEPDGFGSDEGTCGYGADVGNFPFSALVSAGGPSLFLTGKGCGTCYQVRCTSNSACSGSPVTVVITDYCTGEHCISNATHFDLSGTAFAALANSGEKETLLNASSIQIEYQRVPCNYPGTPLTFKIGRDASPSDFAVLIEYVPGDGDLAQVELQQRTVSAAWLPLQQSYGAIWELSSESALKGPFSIRITTQASKSLVAKNVIPANWAAGATYTADVSF